LPRKVVDHGKDALIGPVRDRHRCPDPG
jgi:hypothetical protein